MKGGPWNNTYICNKLHRTVFVEFIRNAKTDRNKLMCSIDKHEKDYPPAFDDGSSGGGNELPSNSTTAALVSICSTINFIDCWLQFLEHNLLKQSNMHFETMINMFQKIPVEIPKPLGHYKNRNNQFVLL